MNDTGQTQLRTDLLAWMDQLQHRMDSLAENLAMGAEHPDSAERCVPIIFEDYGLLSEHMLALP